jgi:Methyltransferase domain
MAVDEIRLRMAIAALRRVPVGQRPSQTAISGLQRAWGNEGFAAKTEYVAEVVTQVLTTRGPILECGSGLTTLLVAALACRRGVQAWSLEHDAAWRRKVVRAVKKISTAITVVDAPLRDYGTFEWYAPSVPLPSDFRLVICDGPPATTIGGRSGLVPIMGDALAPDATIVLDDVTRLDEQAAMAQWARKGWQAEIRGTYAIIHK